MYIPNTFKEKDIEKLIQIMKQNPFATIVTTDNKGVPVATPLPFLIKQDGDTVLLQAHFAKANPQWQHLENNSQVLVIFQGPHCYISPSWYKNPGVPTWDYVTVHTYGTAKLFTAKQTVELIEELSDKYEHQLEKPWQAKNNYSETLLDHIIGFEINVQELQGKVKIGQNKSGEDLSGVIQALSKSSSELDKQIAILIKKHLESKD